MEFDYNYPGVLGMMTSPGFPFTPLPAQPSQIVEEIVLKGSSDSNNTLYIQGTTDS